MSLCATWCGFSDTCGYGKKFFASPDLTVIYLDHAVLLSRYAHLPTAGLVDQLPAKQAVTLVGYGATSFAKGLPVFEAARTTSPGFLSPNNNVIAADFLPVAVQSRASLCFGDSGSPVLL